MECEFFSITCRRDGERLDKFLADEMAGVSRSRVQSLIKDGLVFVSGERQKPSYKLSAGEIIDGEIPQLVEISAKPVEMLLNIVYEDNHLIVVDKPKNMVVHPAPGHIDDTLVNGLLHHCGDSLSGINGALRPGIVHRIDKDTTGLIVAAKTDKAHISLCDQLQRHSVLRIYDAIVFGNIKDDNGTIDAPIGRSPTNRLKMSVVPKNGKPAVTHYSVCKRFGKFTHIRAKLETGRTHQIRVHMSSIGFPLLGDTLYSSIKQPFKIEGQALHAGIIGFVHPETDDFMRFESDPPQYFIDLLSKLDMR